MTVWLARRTAEDVDQIERPKNENERECCDNREGGCKHGEGDVAEDAPLVGSVEFGRILQIFGNILQAGQIKNDCHTVPLPELNEIYDLHCPKRLRLPLMGKLRQSVILQERVDDANDWIKH